MTTSIVLNIFSGRPNPRKTLSARSEKKLFARIAKLRRGSQTRIPRALLGSFTVTRKVGPRTIVFFVGGGLVDFPSLPGSYVDSEAVNQLLFSLLRSSLVSSRLERTLLAYQYSGFRLANLSTFKCGVNRTVDAQGFDLYWGAGYTPDWMIWNRQPCNNCYDYANYQLTDTYSQPGVGGGKHFRGYSCKEVTYAAQLDGLRPAPTLKTLGPGQGWYVALFLGKVGTEDDFHWVKQDSSGCWSHKLGSAMPSDLDSKWNKIKFPQNAAFSYHNGLINYPTFCGFFRTHAAVIIRGLDPPGCPPVY